jgi:hypothetical protein
MPAAMAGAVRVMLHFVRFKDDRYLNAVFPIRSAWLSIRPPQLAGTPRNDLLTTLIQPYEGCFLVQHLLKPPMALTVSGGFF